MKIAFIIHNFNRPNHKLQPRQFIHRVGCLLASEGHKITVITDKRIEERIDGISIIGLNNSVGSKQEAYLKTINQLMPDVVIVSTSFTSMFSNGNLFSDIKAPIVANFSFPIYNFKKILSQFPRSPLRSSLYYLLNHVVRFPSAKRMKKQNLKLIICQSKTNKEKLSSLGISKDKILHLPPGIDKKTWFPDSIDGESTPDQFFKFLFFGPPRNARGLQVLLNAYKRIAKLFPQSNLKLLLRGANKDDIQKVDAQLEQYGISDKVEIIGDWVSAEKLRLAIWKSSIVVIPFVFSESDMPVTILEAKACGKPVISTDVCSVPEMVGRGGIVIPANSEKHLIAAMSKVIERPEYLKELQTNALTEMSSYPTWGDIADEFLHGVKNAIEK